VLRGGVDDIACSDELVCVRLTALTRVVADSTAPPCLPAVVAVVLCLELVASIECILLLEIDTVAHGKRGTVHEA
jgi:hypothetical protein